MSRRADAANIGERRTPPKKQLPGARAEGQPEVTGHPEVTPGNWSDMDTRVPGGKESRRADAAEIGERGTPPKRQLPGAREHGQPEVPGHPEVTQGRIAYGTFEKLIGFGTGAGRPIDCR